MSLWQRILHHPFIIRLFKWEYWSFHAVYFLVYPVWLFLCLRSRSLFFFSASNPSIENGGVLMESKKKIYDLLPPEFYPKTILVSPGESNDRIVEKLRGGGLGVVYKSEDVRLGRYVACVSLNQNERSQRYG